MALHALPVISLATISILFGIFYLFMYVKRPRERVNGSFALLCFVIGIYDIAAFGLYGSTDLSLSIKWQRVQFLSVAGLTFSLGLFYRHLTAGMSRRTLLWIGVVSLVFAVLGIAVRGPLTLSLEQPAVKIVAIGSFISVTYHEVHPGIVYSIQMGFSIVVYTFCLVGLARYLREAGRQTYPLVLSMIAFYAFTVNDALVGLGVYPFLYLIEYGFALVIIAMSYIMVSNFLDLYAQVEGAKQRLESAVEERTAELRALNETLTGLASRDGLTGAFNRRIFMERMGEEMAVARRYGDPFCLLFLDVDYFKSVNDMYGHQAGDGALESLSAILSATLRTTDILCRYGGEEFGIILPHVDGPSGFRAAERLRVMIAKNEFSHGHTKFKITVSIGVTSFPENRSDGVEEMIAKADRALYRAK